MKKIFWMTVILIVLSFLLFSIKKDYNLVLISVDSLRPDSINTNAPNIAKLKDSATTFEKAYTIYPNSVGSYYTLFTGNSYLVNNELSTLKFIESFNATKDKDYVNLASQLKKTGFTTTAFLANPKLNSNIVKYGFDEFTGQLDNAAVSQNAVNKIKASFGKRFFVWADFKVPDAVKIDETKQFLCSPVTNIVETSNKITTVYSQNVKQVDAEVGKVLAALKSVGADRNTIVVIYSDKGENFDQRFYGLGKTLSESDVRTVLIVKEPQQTTSNVVLAAIDNSKVSGLIMSLLEKNQLKSKVSEFTNKGLTFFRISYGKNLKVAATDSKYKYIYNLTTDACLPEKDASEFYDLIRDPKEKSNLIGDPTKQEKANEMKVSLSGQTMVPIKNLGEKIDVIDRLKSLGY